MRFIPAGALNRTTGLEILNLSGNLLETIQPKDFQLLAQLEELYMDKTGRRQLFISVLYISAFVRLVVSTKQQDVIGTR